ncbi:lysM and putative peptidoglycan-binding domain-containing protein 1 isoform X2 [Toxorhynchites rutilus septentrionalis]|nr:lysM and putative peptidoglycan-binding domain-containing protein 1 isoform X2 [Toxorhynchites rutilus septentrionalis]
MEDETIFGEKQSIRDSARTLKKYGTISNSGSCVSGSAACKSPALCTEALIRHEIGKTDTLQGIALKYGCTMEQIRRVNRLLPTDTIFLRQSLMIPVEKDSVYYPKDPSAIIRPNSLSLRSTSTAGCPSSSSASTPMDQAVSEGNLVSPEEESRKNMEEFLGKIDSSIASTRKYIAESQRNSEFGASQSDDNIFSSGASMNSSGYYSKPRAYSTASSSSSISSYQQYHYHNSGGASRGASSSQHHKRQSSSGSAASDTSQLIVMTQGKRVQSSLQKLEKQQDELFEL